MSELAKTIDRLEQWVAYWEPHQVPELIADLRVLIGAAKAAQRAAEMLEGAQRHELDYVGDMEPCSHGDWLLFDDVIQAIKSLQEPKP